MNCPSGHTTLYGNQSFWVWVLHGASWVITMGGSPSLSPEKRRKLECRFNNSACQWCFGPKLKCLLILWLAIFKHMMILLVVHIFPLEIWFVIHLLLLSITQPWVDYGMRFVAGPAIKACRSLGCYKHNQPRSLEVILVSSAEILQTALHQHEGAWLLFTFCITSSIIKPILCR